MSSVIETREMVDVSRIERKPNYETTRTGKYWRETSIDEIIQFWHVVKGEMSLIGYRPIPEYYVPHLHKLCDMDRKKFKQYLGVVGQFKPGMSSLSSVKGRGNLTMQEKFKYDLEYAQNASIWYDMKLLFQTIVIVITQDGAK